MNTDQVSVLATAAAGDHSPAVLGRAVVLVTAVVGGRRAAGLGPRSVVTAAAGDCSPVALG